MYSHSQVTTTTPPFQTASLMDDYVVDRDKEPLSTKPETHAPEKRAYAVPGQDSEASNGGRNSDDNEVEESRPNQAVKKGTEQSHKQRNLITYAASYRGQNWYHNDKNAWRFYNQKRHYSGYNDCAAKEDIPTDTEDQQEKEDLA